MNEYETLNAAEKAELGSRIAGGEISRSCRQSKATSFATLTSSSHRIAVVWMSTCVTAAPVV